VVAEGGRTVGAATADSLLTVFHEYDVKTVINLRASHPEEDWWEEERAVAEAAGVTLGQHPDERAVAAVARGAAVAL